MVTGEFRALIVVLVTQIYTRDRIARNYLHTKVSTHGTGGSKVYGLCQCQRLGGNNVP